MTRRHACAGAIVARACVVNCANALALLGMILATSGRAPLGPSRLSDWWFPRDESTDGLDRVHGGVSFGSASYGKSPIDATPAVIR
jgi:hypothetical protein